MKSIHQVTALAASASAAATVPSIPRMVAPSALSFSTLCDFFEHCRSAENRQTRLNHLQKFLQTCLPPASHDLFAVYRLLLPHLDSDRKSYSMAADKFVKAAVAGCGMDPACIDAQRSLGWKKTNSHQGSSFASILRQHVFGSRCGVSDGSPEERQLKVGDLNQLLDALANAEGIEAKGRVIAKLIQRCSPRMMCFITMIVLRTLKLGVKEGSVFKQLHPDAEHLFQMTMNLHTVCSQLHSRSVRVQRQQVQVGKPVQPQCCISVKEPEQAFKRLKSPTLIVDSKLDGWRFQLHRDGDSCHFFSRRGIEHSSTNHFDCMAPCVLQQLRHKRMVLDGEIVVWNTSRGKFEPWGGLQQTATAAHEGLAADEEVSMSRNGELTTTDPNYRTPKVKDIELVYVVFDILYLDCGSVIDRPLKERQALLRKALEDAPPEGISISKGAMKGRIELMIPGQRFLGGAPASWICKTADEVQQRLDNVIRVQEEGLVLKRPDSKWEPNERARNWAKLKPENRDADLDCVIIGVYHGHDHGGGGLCTSYLVALADGPCGNQRDGPTTYSSFCKVGSGHTHQERRDIFAKLKLLLAQPGARMPSCYRVAGERPDLWVTDPSQSIVLQVKGDMRMMVSRLFATRYSLRFPIIERVRWDKPPSQVDTEQHLQHIANAAGGGLAAGDPEEGEEPERKRRRRKASAQKARKSRPRAASPNRGVRMVLDSFRPTDTTGVAVEADIFAGSSFLVVDMPSVAAKAKAEILIKRLGGQVVQSYVAGCTTYIISGSCRKGSAILGRSTSGGSSSGGCRSAFSASHAAAGRNILDASWLEECEAAGAAVPRRPRHYIHAEAATLASAPDSDARGDSLYEDTDARDLPVLLSCGAAARTTEPAEQWDAAAAAAAHQDCVAAAQQAMMAASQAGHRPFWGCTVSVVRLLPAAAVSTDADGTAASEPTAGLRPTAEAAALAASAERQQKQLAATTVGRLHHQVRKGGGSICSVTDAAVSHIVIVPHPSQPALLREASSGSDWQCAKPASPAAVLAALSAAAAADSTIAASSGAAAAGGSGLTAPAAAATHSNGLPGCVKRAASAPAAVDGTDSASESAVQCDSRASAMASAAALTSLCARLESGRAVLVMPSWVESGLASGLAADARSDSSHSLLVAGPDGVCSRAVTWPWHEFGVPSEAAASEHQQPAASIRSWESLFASTSATAADVLQPGLAAAASAPAAPETATADPATSQPSAPPPQQRQQHNVAELEGLSSAPAVTAQTGTCSSVDGRQAAAAAAAAAERMADAAHGASLLDDILQSCRAQPSAAAASLELEMTAATATAAADSKQPLSSQLPPLAGAGLAASGLGGWEFGLIADEAACATSQFGPGSQLGIGQPAWISSAVESRNQRRQHGCGRAADASPLVVTSSIFDSIGIHDASQLDLYSQLPGSGGTTKFDCNRPLPPQPQPPRMSWGFESQLLESCTTGGSGTFNMDAPSDSNPPPPPQMSWGCDSQLEGLSSGGSLFKQEQSLLPQLSWSNSQFGNPLNTLQTQGPSQVSAADFGLATDVSLPVCFGFSQTVYDSFMPDTGKVSRLSQAAAQPRMPLRQKMALLNAAAPRS